jgi:hypothetical protein
MRKVPLLTDWMGLESDDLVRNGLHHISASQG